MFRRNIPQNLLRPHSQAVHINYYVLRICVFHKNPIIPNQDHFSIQIHRLNSVFQEMDLSSASSQQIGRCCLPHIPRAQYYCALRILITTQIANSSSWSAKTALNIHRLIMQCTHINSYTRALYLNPERRPRLFQKLYNMTNFLMRCPKLSQANAVEKTHENAFLQPLFHLHYIAVRK